MTRLYSEKFYHSDPYIACPRYKGRPRKHVAVCGKCRWRRNCRAFQDYWQPELPLIINK